MAPMKQHLKVSGGTTLWFDHRRRTLHVETRNCYEPQREPSPTGIIRMAPEGDQALAQVNNDIGQRLRCQNYGQQGLSFSG